MTRNEGATQKTTSTLLEIARKHFSEYGYTSVSIEKIAKEGNVTRGAVYHHFKNKKGLFLAVLNAVQQDVAIHIEQEAMKSNDMWEQLILGCVGFVKGTNAEDCRRILLVDAPAAVGWEVWRKADQDNSTNILHTHIQELKAKDYLDNDVDTDLMTYSISGALNELALRYISAEYDQILHITITHTIDGFRKKT